jgi:uncharacterized membrane protein YjgN (DUF898 family)
MAGFHASVPAAHSGGVAQPAEASRFRGSAGDYWRLLVHGAVLLMLTLGIYRFWLTTDIRRFLWLNTELAGESFEYVGTAREILLGFLIAVAILLPLYSGFFLLTLGLGAWAVVSNLLALLMLAVLGQYAAYRARRYRLTRTVYRGIRFHQTGSAWRYATCAALWWTLTVLTLGLAYPFAQARLERFKMGNTFFGDLPGRFEGSALRLLLRGLLLWFLAVVPVIAGLGAFLLGIDWSALPGAGGEDLLNRLEAGGLGHALVYGALAGAWLLLAIAILYPLFQAMVLRWWMSGLRFGDVTVTSHLRTAQVLGLYGRFLWYAFLFTLAATAIVGLGTLVIGTVTPELDPMAGEVVVTLALLAAYVALALGYSTIYQATVRLGLWRCVVDSLAVSNLAVLDHVSAAGAAASPVGEGLADALNVGGV